MDGGRDRAPVAAQREPYDIRRQSDRHVVRAIKRVNQPGPGAIPLVHTRFLGHDAMSGKRPAQPPDNQLFRLEVEAGDQVPGAALLPDGERSPNTGPK
jgi:hypothetical protein